jgi:hypothetical protein
MIYTNNNEPYFNASKFGKITNSKTLKILLYCFKISLQHNNDYIYADSNHNYLIHYFHEK